MSVLGKDAARIKKAPRVMRGLMWPPDAGRAAKIKRGRMIAARIAAINDRRKGDSILLG